MIIDSKRDLAEFLRKQFVKLTTTLQLDNRVLPVSIVTDDHLQVRSILPGRAAAGGTTPVPGAGLFATTRLVAIVDCVIESFESNGGACIVTDDTGAINANYVKTAPWQTFQTGDRSTPAKSILDWGTLSIAATPAGVYAGSGTIPTYCDIFIPSGSFAFLSLPSPASPQTVSMTWREPK